MFWTGVGLAPVAAALLLLSSSAAGLRVAAVLTILTVVLVGLSIMLRQDVRTLRAEIEDQLFEEIDALREDIRKDIAGAVRATHRSHAEKLQTLYQTVDALRTQVEALRAGTPEPTSSPVGSAMVAGGVVRHTETVQVTTRQMIVDQERSTGTVYGARPAEPAHSARVPEESWTEQRLRERLAEVQTGEPRRPRPYERDEPQSYREQPPSHTWSGEDGRWGGGRPDDTWGSGRLEDHWTRREPPAITASGPEPASTWTESWRDDPAPVNPRPRRPDYEMSDKRWR